MSFHLQASSGGGEFELAPEGTHNAVCTRVIDLGTQDSGLYGPKHQIMVGFELDSMREEDGKPFMAFSYYTLSMNEKANLRKHLESWRGRTYGEGEGVNLDALVGKPALLTIVHGTSEQTGKTRAKITGISPLVRGMTPLAPVGDTICLSLDRDEFDNAEYEKLSDRMQERVRETPEWRALTAKDEQPQTPVGTGAITEEELDDDIPF